MFLLISHSSMITLHSDSHEDLFLLTLEFHWPVRCMTHSKGSWAGLALENKMQQDKVKSILPREPTGHSKHSLPTTKEKILNMDIT